MAPQLPPECGSKIAPPFYGRVQTTLSLEEPMAHYLPAERRQCEDNCLYFSSWLLQREARLHSGEWAQRKSWFRYETALVQNQEIGMDRNNNARQKTLPHGRDCGWHQSLFEHSLLHWSFIASHENLRERSAANYVSRMIYDTAANPCTNHPQGSLQDQDKIWR